MSIKITTKGNMPTIREADKANAISTMVHIGNNMIFNINSENNAKLTLKLKKSMAMLRA